MGSDVTKAYGAEKRSDMFWFVPERLTIVDDPEHELHDPYRVVEPLEEAFVQNIVELGIIKPIVVRLNGKDKKGNPIVEVADGRRRTRGAREANRILKKNGGVPIMVPAIAKKGDEVFFMKTMIALNEHQKQDSMLAKAKKAQRLLNINGNDIDNCAMHFNVTANAIRSWVKLLDCSKAVQNAIHDGTISPSIASKLVDMPRAEQDKALADMIASGATKGASAEAAVNRAKEGSLQADPGTADKATPRARRGGADDGDARELVPSKPSLKKLATRIEEQIAEGKWSEKNALIAKTIAQTIAFVMSGEKLPGVAANVYEKVAEEVRAKRQVAAKRAFEKRAQSMSSEDLKASSSPDDENDEQEEEAAIVAAIGGAEDASAEDEDALEDDAADKPAEAAAEIGEEETAREKDPTVCSVCDGLGFSDHTLKTICKACDGGASAEAERALDAAIAADVEGGAVKAEGTS